jgi:hypothetical protein
MAKVDIKTRGVRGGEFSAIKETAHVVVFVDGADYISVDSFEGQGNSYKKRNKSQIEIQIGDAYFKGTAEELYEILKK